MSQANLTREPWPATGVRHYIVIAAAGIAIVGVVAFQRTGNVVALVPVLAGVAGSLSGIGPMLLVITLAVCMNAPVFISSSGSRSLFSDGLLCVGVLAYVISHFRLQSLLTGVFPGDPRRRRAAVKRRLWGILPGIRRIKPERRKAELVTHAEIGNVLWSLPIWALLAQYVWMMLPNSNPSLELPTPLWRAIVLAWLFGIVALLVASVLGYLRNRKMSPADALIYLQDLSWAETRREQRRLNRWLVWARRRKEKP